MDLAAFLLKLPKISLHLRLEGAIRPATFVDLAAKHNIPLPNYSDPAIAGITAVNPYEMAIEHMGCGPADLKTFVMNGIDGAWLDESTKREWRPIDRRSS